MLKLHYQSHSWVKAWAMKTNCQMTRGLKMGHLTSPKL